jgi:hypothetical protein
VPVPVASIVVLLAASPLGMFVCHMVAHRLLRVAGRRPTAHTSAFAAIIGCAVVLLAAVGALAWNAVTGSPVTAACLLAYVLALYGSLAVLYLDVVNIAETSLHMHLLLEIAWSERPSLGRLIERYSPERMVEERLARLIALGQVRLVDGRYQLANRSALRLSRAIDFWRTVLGLPTSPATVDEH